MNEFVPKLVLDSRIHDITDKVEVAVESSAAQSTYQEFPSVNSSNSSITFNVNIPSENIAVDRSVLIQTAIKFQLSIGNVPENDLAFQWGETDGLGQFPLNAMFQQVQATINNVAISVPLDDVLPPLLRLCNQHEVAKLNSGLTASYIDQNLSRLEYATQYASNPLGGWKKVSPDTVIKGRGTTEIAQLIVKQYDANGEEVNANSLISLDETNYFIVQCLVFITEPFLFLSPFTGLVKSKDSAAFLGINNMNIVCNIKSDLTSLYKTTNVDYTHEVQLGWTGENVGFENPKLLMNFLTLQPEQYMRVNTRNVLPIQDYPRYVSSDSRTITASNAATYTFTFPVIQLNQVPDTLIIFVRPNKNTVTGYGKNTAYGFATQSMYYTIKKASITFNNQSGICANMNSQQLYLMSKANGSQQSYSDFNGILYSAGVNNATTPLGSAFEPSQGSLLVLKPAYNFNLPNFLSGGSLGQFGLQIQLDCMNNFGYGFTQSDMVVIAVNNGLMVTQQGSSILYSGLLNKNMVLETKQNKPVIDSSTLSDLTGGSIQEACSTGLRKVLKKHFGNKSGSGMSAGGLSAGGLSAGRQHNRMSKYM